MVVFVHEIFSNVPDILHLQVETIGDAYMCASGLPQRNTYHGIEICKMLLKLMQYVSHFKIEHKPGRKLQLRAGVHTGIVFQIF